MKRRVFIHESLGLLAIMVGGQMVSCIQTKKDPENAYEIKQFEDEGLSHFSYAVLVDKKIVLIDPARDPQPYYDYALNKGAKIIGVIETHPHADFVISHLQIHYEKGANISVSKLVRPDYPHQ